VLGRFVKLARYGLVGVIQQTAAVLLDSAHHVGATFKFLRRIARDPYITYFRHLSIISRCFFKTGTQRALWVAGHGYTLKLKSQPFYLTYFLGELK
jgi:hypothetical protein